MKFEHINHYDISPAGVYAMLGDPAFRQSVGELTGAVRYDVTVTPTEDGRTLLIDQEQAPGRIPTFAQKFTGGGALRIVDTETWSDPTTATLQSTFPGTGDRAHVQATIVLAPHGESGTTATYSVEITVDVPFVAGTVEKLLAQGLVTDLQSQATAARDWTARP